MHSTTTQKDPYLLVVFFITSCGSNLIALHILMKKEIKYL